MYAFSMRTTIEIPDELREKLVSEAARLGEKGYSGVVQRALRSYFERKSAPKERQETIRRLRGSEAGDLSVEEEYARIASVRGNWRSGNDS